MLEPAAIMDIREVISDVGSNVKGEVAIFVL